MKVVLFVILILSFLVNLLAYPQSIVGDLIAKTKCPIRLYDPNDSSFTGVKLYTNVNTFHPLLHTLSKYAKDCQVKIYVKQAFIQENARILNSRIHDHSQMAFRFGEAIQFELHDENNRILCNELCLRNNSSDGKCFLDKVSKDSNIKQDTMQANILYRQPTIQSLVEVQEKRKILQNLCNKLKLEA